MKKLKLSTTVTVLQNGANLDFTVQLLGSLVFQKSTGFDAFAFGFSDKVASITNIVDNGPGTFTSDPASTGQDGFGTFKQGILNSVTGGTTLSFTALSETLANLTVSTIPPGDTHRQHRQHRRWRGGWSARTRDLGNDAARLYWSGLCVPAITTQGIVRLNTDELRGTRLGGFRVALFY